MNASELKGKAAVVVIDGMGLIPQVEGSICKAVWEQLEGALRKKLEKAVGDPELAVAALAPTSHGVARAESDWSGTDWQETFQRIREAHDTTWNLLAELSKDEDVTQIRMDVARDQRYAPWAVHTPFLFALRQKQPTWITRTAGVFTGFDDMDPEVMGNSDTGHQQIFNLTVARQVPTFISHLIESGEFFRNQALNKDLEVARSGGVVVFKTLLSGEFGDDGYVHSAWRHMEAFFKLYFETLRLPASALQVEAVLDGRDSPVHSSLEFGQEEDGQRKYGFLHKLRNLLKRYGAESSLAWVIGRQFMDRDYKGNMIRKEYELVTGNVGRKVASLDEAYALVAADHSAGKIDAMVDPIVIGSPRPLGPGTVLFNAIFRSDRQEPITATLLGYREFIERQATQKKRIDSWDGFSWLRDIKGGSITGLRMWSMVDYHKDFPARGAMSVFKDRPHDHNILHLLNRTVQGFRYLLLTEGVKEKHMGLFSRGRRSTPLTPSETQVIIPTWGKEQGVLSDNDLYKVPRMRHDEIAAELCALLSSPEFHLAACNFPGPDMIGHLKMDHFDACLATLSSIEDALAKVVPAALANGWVLMVTSDHGNVEHDGPDHGNNDVLTTLCIPDTTRFTPAAPAENSARLFDVAATVLAVLGVSVRTLDAPPIPDELARDPRRLVGASLVHPVA